MKLFDDKTKNVIKSGSKLLINKIDSSEDITFKASFIISSNLRCIGKVTALFNLIVLGDISAEEIDVKGRFVCMGNCIVSGAIVVQGDIWCESLNANTVTCHNRIVAQSIDVDSIVADSDIIVGKTLAIEDKAQTFHNVICGETAYGAGKISASKILTVEPLDLDDGEEALENPFEYTPRTNSHVDNRLAKLSAKYAKTNDYSSFLIKLSEIPENFGQGDFQKYLMVLKTVEMSYSSNISEFKDISILLWMIEIANSDYFKEWDIVKKWTDNLLIHFKDIAEGKINNMQDLKTAKKLEKGYVVVHHNYGRGTVCAIQKAVVKGKQSNIATISFESHGEKKFPIPASLKFFKVISESERPSAEELQERIQCNINSYAEWLSFLQLIYKYKEYLGAELYDIAYGLLLAKIGLRPKFVETRFKEKGWN